MPVRSVAPAATPMPLTTSRQELDVVPLRRAYRTRDRRPCGGPPRRTRREFSGPPANKVERLPRSLRGRRSAASRCGNGSPTTSQSPSRSPSLSTTSASSPSLRSTRSRRESYISRARGDWSTSPYCRASSRPVCWRNGMARRHAPQSHRNPIQCMWPFRL
jgi:hypothetical protein